jgi:type IV pilus assembly protein PilQ
MAALASPDDGVNDVHGVTVAQSDDQTVIRIAGDDRPTFSVYRLQRPLRLFVDISSSRIDGAPASVSVDNGIIADVSTVEYSDDLTNVTRVVVSFLEDAPYDVVADGNDLVLTIDGAPVMAPMASTTPMEVLGELQAGRERMQALELALSDAQSRAAAAEQEVLQTELERQRAEQQRLEALAAQQAMASQLHSLSTEQAAAQTELETLHAELRRRDAAASELQSQLNALASQGADQTEIETLRNQQVAASSEASQLRDRLTQLERERDEALAASASIEQLRIQAAQSQEQASQAMQTVSQQQQAIEALEGERRDAQSRLEALRAEWSGAQEVASGPGVVRDVRFEQTAGVDRIIIDVSQNPEFLSEPWDDGRASLVLSDAVLPDELRRTLDTQAYGGPVRAISSYTEADGTVRVVADIGTASSEILRSENGRIVWEFTSSSTSSVAAAAPVAGTYASSPEPAGVYAGAYTAQNAAFVGGTYRQESPFQQRPRLSNKRITIDLRNADIQNVLRLLADEGNINIVASDQVSGSVTLRLRSVALDEALAIILQSKGYGWMQEGSVLRVAPLAEFEDEYGAYIERLRLAQDLEPLQVRLFPLNYMLAGQLQTAVSSVVSSRGAVVTNLQSNSLIVTDVAANIGAIEQLIRQLDVQTPQILIEARIVETNDQFRRQLGIQWGGDFIAAQSTGNATGLLFPSTVGIAGGADDPQASLAGTSSSPNFAVNLPAPAGAGSGGAIGLTLGSLSGAFNLNVRLSAAEDQGSAKIISAPRIMTLHNQAASITSGVSIPVSVVSAAGNQTVFFDAALTLNVTPRVTPDGNIFLTVGVTKNEPDFENTGARGDPSIVRREANTQLLVRDGDTTVIGGIFQRNTGFSSGGVPFFSQIPILGPLFRNSSRTDVRNELLVFITPRIVNRDMSIDMLGAGGPIMRPDDNANDDL